MPCPSALNGLYLCEAAIRKHFRARDGAGVVGGEKDDCLRDLLGCTEPVGALWPLFPRDPLADIGWAMEDGNTYSLRTAEESHQLDIHQRHLVEIQRCPGPRFSNCAFKASRCSACLHMGVAEEPLYNNREMR